MIASRIPKTSTVKREHTNTLEDVVVEIIKSILIVIHNTCKEEEGCLILDYSNNKQQPSHLFLSLSLSLFSLSLSFTYK